MLGMKFARKYILRLELLTYQRADKLKQEARYFAQCVLEANIYAQQSQRDRRTGNSVAR